MNRYEEGFAESPKGEPVLHLNFNMGGEVTRLAMSYENTAIFTHAEPFRHLDHIFVEIEELEDDEEYRSLGAFVWRQVLPDWEDLKSSLDKRNFQHIHSPYPSEHDLEQYEVSGLKPPKSLFSREKPTEEVRVIEEEGDDDVVERAMAKIDAELYWFLNDPHYFLKRKPRDGE